MAVKRQKVYYHERCIVDEYASSTGIRDMMRHNEFKDIRRVMPSSAYGLLREEYKKGNYMFDLSKFEHEIIYLLRRMTIEEIKKYPDVGEGLENLLKSAANESNTLYDLINIVKSKRYTQTRIQRILLHILLGIQEKDMQVAKKITPYIRVLGFNDNGRMLLSQITKANPKLSMITSVKKYMDQCNNKQLKNMLEKDIFATNIYTLGYEYDSWANLDYTQKIVTI